MRLDIPDAFNLADYLVSRHVREGRGARVAVRHEAGTLTYAELDNRSSRAGTALLSLGLGHQQRVLLALQDSPAFYVGFLGAIKAGLVPVPVSTLLRDDDYRYIVADSAAAALIVGASLLPELLPAAHAATSLRHVLVAGDSRAGLASLDDLVEAAPPLPACAPTRRDDPAFWLYSSGSTGEPKAVVQLQHDAVWTVEGYARGVLGLTEADHTFSAAKLFFAYGFGNSLTFPLAVGAEAAIVSKRLGPEATFEAIAAFEPTIFFGVPTLFAAMLQVDDIRAQQQLLSLRCCVSAGAPGRDLSAMARSVRLGDPRRHRVDRAPAHLHLQSPWPLPAGHVGRRGPRLPGSPR